MAIEKQINIVVKEVGLDKVQKDVNNLDASLDKLQDTNKKTGTSFKDSANSVLENGGAMGLLNDATGGLAMTVKDAVEASVLFTKNTKIATIAQKVWNWAMKANPIGLLVAAILLAITAITSLTMYLYNNAKANEAAMNATARNTKALEAQSIAAKRAGDALKISNDQNYAMAQASGASTEALRKLTVKHNEEAIALNLKNAKIAQSTFLRQRDTLAILEANGASDEAIEKQKKLTDATYKEFQEQNKLLSDSYKERHAIERKNAVEVLTEKTAASQKAASEAEAARQKEKDRIKSDREKEKADAVQAIKDLAKAKADAEMQSAKDAIAILDELKKNVETPAQKEQREYEEKKAVLEANNLSTAELDRQHKEFIAQQNNDFFAAESDKAIKRDADEKARDEKKKADKILAEQTTKDALVLMAESTASIFDSLEALGLKKSKAAQAIRKGIALAQIAVDTGKAIGSAVELAQKAGVAAQTAAPMVPGIGTVATIASYASSASMIFSNVAKAKQLLSGGGSGGGGGSTGGGGGSMPSAPSFNLVQGTSSNQIASSINTQQPIEAFVVSKNVSTGQERDRNIIKSASL